MPNSLSVLQNFKSSMVVRAPFTHVVIENSLPAETYVALSRDYPSPDVIFRNNMRKRHTVMSSNTRYDIAAATVYSNKSLDIGLWRDFVLYHTSQDFLDEFMDKLGDVVAREYPQLLAAIQRKIGGSRPRAGVRRHSDSQGDCDIALDCQVGMNSKVTETASSVKSLHIDDAKELFAGLFYCRDQNDRTEGGDLLIYKRKPGREISFYDERFIRAESAEVAGTVPYSANTFAMLFNGLDAIHAVSPRPVTEHHRRLVNIIMEVYPTLPRLFDERPYAEEKGIVSWLKRKIF